MTKFQKAVLAITRAIPPGRVMSYGQVAAYVASPGAARQVGWALRSLDGAENFPWWRVVNNSGRITIKGNQFSSRDMQKQLLQQEGVKVGTDMRIAIEQYRYLAKPSELKELGLAAEYVEQIMRRYPPI